MQGGRRAGPGPAGAYAWRTPREIRPSPNPIQASAAHTKPAASAKKMFDARPSELNDETIAPTTPSATQRAEIVQGALRLGVQTPATRPTRTGAPMRSGKNTINLLVR